MRRDGPITTIQKYNARRLDAFAQFGRTCRQSVLFPPLQRWYLRRPARVRAANCVVADVLMSTVRSRIHRSRVRWRYTA